MWDKLILWLTNNYIELFGFLTGGLYIILSIMQSVWLWPVGLVTSATYIVVFFQSTLYADMALQVYYLLVSIYGWYFWVFGKKKNQELGDVKISKLNPIYWVWAVIVTLVLTVALYFPMKKYTNASNPLWDGFVTAGSVVATWMLARKILEQWLIWIIVDGASIALFFIKGLYMTAILFIAYTILAFVGYLKWVNDFKKQEA